MNLFLLSWNIAECAAFHCDKHVVKMILELTQMLFTAHYILGTDLSNIPVKKYKQTHTNHPVSIWVRETMSNYYFTVYLGLQLCYEYSLRYGKKNKEGLIIEHKIHASQPCLYWLFQNAPKITSVPDVITQPAVAMSDEFKIYEDGVLDPIASYRNFYNKEKSRFAKWKTGRIPIWFNNEYDKDESLRRELASRRNKK